MDFAILLGTGKQCGENSVVEFISWVPDRRMVNMAQEKAKREEKNLEPQNLWESTRRCQTSENIQEQISNIK